MLGPAVMTCAGRFSRVSRRCVKVRSLSTVLPASALSCMFATRTSCMLASKAVLSN